MNQINRCGECGCVEGQLHEPGCFSEPCPFCGNQLMSCGCCYTMLGLRNKQRYTEDTDYLPPRIFYKGLSEEQCKTWEALLEEKGRVPYIYYPQICGRCGVHWPEYFMVPDDEWQRYVDPAHRKLILCPTCYEQIKAIINKGVAVHAPAVSS